VVPHAEDRLKYDLLPQVQQLSMPVLLVVGEFDTSTPPTHQKILYDALPGPKELHVIKGAPHTFRDVTHLREIRQIVSSWLNKLS
jgi:pimeloyl-ACP methyl ester carboxylesterase